MDSDWSVACGADDPEIMIPWGGEPGAKLPLRYIDLRNNPAAIKEIPEAKNYPCVAEALRRWNQNASPVFTAKSDVWAYDARYFDAEDFPDAADAQASYIDLLTVDPSVFGDFAASERQLRAWCAAAMSINMFCARCEWILRPARILASKLHLSQQGRVRVGFATTLYVWGYGEDAASAARCWSDALLALIDPVLSSSPR